jgi:putative sterol carrier protein
MSDVTSLLDTMQQRFNPGAASGMDEIFQYDIDDEGSWHIIIKQDQCEIAAADETEASVTLSMTKDTLASVINGDTDGMQAFMMGDIKASGDVMLATRLSDLFPLA